MGADRVPSFGVSTGENLDVLARRFTYRQRAPGVDRCPQCVESPTEFSRWAWGQFAAPEIGSMSLVFGLYVAA